MCVYASMLLNNLTYVTAIGNHGSFMDKQSGPTCAACCVSSSLCLGIHLGAMPMLQLSGLRCSVKENAVVTDARRCIIAAPVGSSVCTP